MLSGRSSTDDRTTPPAYCDIAHHHGARRPFGRLPDLDHLCRRNPRRNPHGAGAPAPAARQPFLSEPRQSAVWRGAKRQCRAGLADALALEALFDIRSGEQAQLWFQRARWIDAAIQSLGYATTDALALGQSSVEFAKSLTGDSDAPVAVEASIAEPSSEAQAEEAVAALVEQQRIEDEVERQAAVTPKTDVPTIPAPDPVLEPPLVKPEHVVRLEAQIVEMRHVIQAQDAQLASTGAQLDALGQELNLALARLASAKRDISSEAAQLVALKAERGFLDLRIQELEAENTRLLSSSPAKIPDPEITTPNPPTHRVNRSQINARQGPGTGFGIITTLTRNTPISLVEVSDGWGKFKLLQGQSAGALVWISLSLVKAAE